MNITVIGASAGLGLETVKRALNRNHTVTGLSRSPIQLIGYENLNSVRGDALNKRELKNVIKDADAVIVTLGTGKKTKITTLYSEFAHLLIEIQKELKTEIPFIIVTGFGIGNSQEYVPWFVRMFLKYKVNNVFTDKAKLEEMIKSSELNWIIVRPGCLKDEELTENYRIETTLFSGMNIIRINRADVADYMVKQAENPSETKKFVGITTD